MKDEKRAPRSYKVKQTPYVKAKRRAEKEHTTLAELIEIWVISYSQGLAIIDTNITEFNKHYKIEKISK